MNRPSLRTPLPILLGVLVISSASAQEAAPTEPPLPLKRVVMFSSSVGFFEHRGEIEGNQQIEFTFKTADINDLLKSLVVQDRGGGRSEEHTSELQSRLHLVCRLLLEKKKKVHS